MGFSGRAMLTQQDFKTGFCLGAPEIKKHYETPRCVCVWGGGCVYFMHTHAHASSWILSFFFQTWKREASTWLTVAWNVSDCFYKNGTNKRKTIIAAVVTNKCHGQLRRTPKRPTVSILPSAVRSLPRGARLLWEGKGLHAELLFLYVLLP